MQYWERTITQWRGKFALSLLACFMLFQQSTPTSATVQNRVDTNESNPHPYVEVGPIKEDPSNLPPGTRPQSMSFQAMGIANDTDGDEEISDAYIRQTLQEDLKANPKLRVNVISAYSDEDDVTEVEQSTEQKTARWVPAMLKVTKNFLGLPKKITERFQNMRQRRSEDKAYRVKTNDVMLRFFLNGGISAVTILYAQNKALPPGMSLSVGIIAGSLMSCVGLGAFSAGIQNYVDTYLGWLGKGTYRNGGSYLLKLASKITGNPQWSEVADRVLERNVDPKDDALMGKILDKTELYSKWYLTEVTFFKVFQLSLWLLAQGPNPFTTGELWAKAIVSSGWALASQGSLDASTSEMVRYVKKNYPQHTEAAIKLSSKLSLYISLLSNTVAVGYTFNVPFTTAGFVTLTSFGIASQIVVTAFLSKIPFDKLFKFPKAFGEWWKGLVGRAIGRAPESPEQCQAFLERNEKAEFKKASGE